MLLITNCCSGIRHALIIHVAHFFSHLPCLSESRGLAAKYSTLTRQCHLRGKKVMGLLCCTTGIAADKTGEEIMLVRCKA